MNPQQMFKLDSRLLEVVQPKVAVGDLVQQPVGFVGAVVDQPLVGGNRPGLVVQPVLVECGDMMPGFDRLGRLLLIAFETEVDLQRVGEAPQGEIQQLGRLQQRLGGPGRLRVLGVQLPQQRHRAGVIAGIGQGQPLLIALLQYIVEIGVVPDGPDQ